MNKFFNTLLVLTVIGLAVWIILDRIRDKEKDKLLLVECSSSQKKDRYKINSLFEADNDYDVIIDGGNLMHVGGGKNVSNIIRASTIISNLLFICRDQSSGTRPPLKLYGSPSSGPPRPSWQREGGRISRSMYLLTTSFQLLSPVNSIFSTT